MRNSLFVVVLLTLAALPVDGGPAGPVTLVEHDTLWYGLSTLSADDGVLAFTHYGHGWVYRLGVASGYGPAEMSGIGGSTHRDVAAWATTIAASGGETDGLYIYYSWPTEITQASTGHAWGYKTWTAHTGTGWFGDSVAIQGRHVAVFVFGTVDRATGNDHVEVYELDRDYEPHLIQTIELPGEITSTTDILHVTGSDLVVIGADAIWHYALAGETWTLAHTIPGEVGRRPMADIGNDPAGGAAIAYSLDGKTVYAAPLSDPLGSRTAMPRAVGTWVGSLAIDDGILALTEAQVVARLEVYGQWNGAWDVAYEVPPHVDGTRAYEKVDTSNGFVVVSGKTYGGFAAGAWTKVFATPESVAYLGSSTHNV